MKTLVFVACLLAAVYASEFEKVKVFYEIYAKCAEELGLTDKTTDAKILNCLNKKVGMYDEQGAIIKKNCIEYLTSLTLDANKHKVTEIILNCLDKEYQNSENNYEKNMRIIECAIQQDITGFFAKSE